MLQNKQKQNQWHISHQPLINWLWVCWLSLGAYVVRWIYCFCFSFYARLHRRVDVDEISGLNSSSELKAKNSNVHGWILVLSFQFLKQFVFVAHRCVYINKVSSAQRAERYFLTPKTVHFSDYFAIFWCSINFLEFKISVSFFTVKFIRFHFHYQWERHSQSTQPIF